MATVARVIDLTKKDSVVLELTKPTTIKVATTGRGTATMRLGPGRWRIKSHFHKMTVWQGFLHYFGFFKRKRYARAERIS